MLSQRGTGSPVTINIRHIRKNIKHKIADILSGLMPNFQMKFIPLSTTHYLPTTPEQFPPKVR
jgi:hypothetical protein